MGSKLCSSGRGSRLHSADRNNPLIGREPFLQKTNHATSLAAMCHQGCQATLQHARVAVVCLHATLREKEGWPTWRLMKTARSCISFHGFFSELRTSRCPFENAVLLLPSVGRHVSPTQTRGLRASQRLSCPLSPWRPPAFPKASLRVIRGGVASGAQALTDALGACPLLWRASSG